jgi:hypothetical protein
MWLIAIAAAVLAVDGFDRLDTHFDQGIVEISVALVVGLVLVIMFALFDGKND